ncbi:zinc-binding dehydrogenase [Paenibacillus sp. P25]|nr:zinc-binding dehydrogenase [Paenibacillus sp. P25]
MTILGLGPIGLAVLAQIKKKYKVQVFAVDPVPERLALAARFGADVLINPKDKDTLQAVDEWTHGEGSNVVIECAGLPLTIGQTIHLVSPGGRIVIVGLTGKDVVFPGQLLTKKDVELLGTRHSVNKFPGVLAFLQENPEISEAFITRIMPFAAIEEALQTARNTPEKVTKIILNYEDYPEG